MRRQHEKRAPLTGRALGKRIVQSDEPDRDSEDELSAWHLILRRIPGLTLVADSTPSAHVKALAETRQSGQRGRYSTRCRKQKRRGYERSVSLKKRGWPIHRAYWWIYEMQACSVNWPESLRK